MVGKRVGKKVTGYQTGAQNTGQTGGQQGNKKDGNRKVGKRVGENVEFTQEGPSRECPSIQASDARLEPAMDVRPFLLGVELIAWRKADSTASSSAVSIGLAARM